MNAAGINENGTIVFSNPATIAIFSSSVGKAIILSEEGNVLLIHDLTPNQNQITLEGFKQGKYAVRIENANHTTLTTFEINHTSQ